MEVMEEHKDIIFSSIVLVVGVGNKRDYIFDDNAWNDLTYISFYILSGKT